MFICLFMLFIYLLIYLFIYLFICLCIYLFINLFIYQFIYLCIYLFESFGVSARKGSGVVRGGPEVRFLSLFPLFFEPRGRCDHAGPLL